MNDREPLGTGADLPVTTPVDAEPDAPAPRPPLPWWKIATGVLAVTTVAALAWGVSTANGLQAQLDAAQTVSQVQQVEADIAEVVSGTQIKALNAQVRVLNNALKTLAKESEDALDAASKERKKLKKQLAKAGDAIVALEQERQNADADAASILAAYQEALAELAAAEQAMADLLSAIAQETPAIQ